MPNHKKHDPSLFGQIEFLSLPGNAIHAYCSIGALKALESYGLLQNIKGVAAGSINTFVAALLAFGYSPQEIERELLSFNFNLMNDKQGSFIDPIHLPSIQKTLSKDNIDLKDKCELLFLLPWSHHQSRPLKKMYAALTNPRTVMETSDAIVEVALNYNPGMWRSEAVIFRMAELLYRKTQNVRLTFGELSLLTKKFNNGYSPFKELFLSGIVLNDHKIKEFNAQSTPDMPLLEALVIALSFPGGSHSILKQDKVMLDGGFDEFIPRASNNSKVLVIGSMIEPHVSERIKNGLDLSSFLYSHSHAQFINQSSNQSSNQFKLSNNALILCDPQGTHPMDLELTLGKKRKLIESGRKKLEDILKTSKGKLIARNSRLEKASDHQYLPEQNSAEQNSAEKNLVEQKFKEYKAIGAELKHQLNNLDLLLKALFFRRHFIFSILKDTVFKEEILKNLRILHEHHNRYKIICRKIERLKSKIKNQEEKENEMVYRTKLKKWTVLAVGYKQERNLFLDGVMKRYRAQGHNPESDFILSVYEDIKRDMHSQNFEVPDSDKSLFQYLMHEKSMIKEFYLKARQLLKQHGQKLQADENSAQKVSENNAVKPKESTSLKEINSKIQEYALFIAKVNQFFFKKNTVNRLIVPAYLKSIAFSAFVIFGIMGLPFATIAKSAQFFGMNPDEQRTAFALINFYSRMTINLDTKLKSFQAAIARFIEKLHEDFILHEHLEDSTPENSYLGKLFQAFLKESGLHLGDILKRKNNESLESYEKRVRKVQKKLSLIEPIQSSLKETVSLVNSRFVKIHKNVRERLLKLNLEGKEYFDCIWTKPKKNKIKRQPKRTR